MTTGSNELRARELMDDMRPPIKVDRASYIDFVWLSPAPYEYPPDGMYLYRADDVERAIIAALARQEEGREAVATEWRWVDERGRAMTNWKQGDPPPMGEVSDAKGTMRVEVRTHPAPPSSGEGDAKWREIIERAADTLQDLGAPLNAEELRALVSGSAQRVSKNAALAELRELMEIPDKDARDAALVSFFRTDGDYMGYHGDAMGWTPEQTARHYLSGQRA